MKKLLKIFITIFAKSIINILGKINAGRYCIDELSSAIVNRKKIIKHKDLKFKFHVPNRLNFFRAETFSTKEPETLNWIDTFKKNSIFWDIGANIGLYSCYAASRANCQVYAFEPSVFNLELLVKNININSLSEKIKIIPFPLCEKLSFNSFNLSNKEWGGAMSNFGTNKDHENLQDLFKYNFNYNTFGLSIDESVKLLNFPKPNYIKIDVDGIEHLILKGANETLSNAESVLVEINDEDKKQSEEAQEYLKKAGFKLKDKLHSEIIEKSKKFDKFFNQIWIR